MRQLDFRALATEAVEQSKPGPNRSVVALVRHVDGHHIDDTDLLLPFEDDVEGRVGAADVEAINPLAIDHLLALVTLSPAGVRVFKFREVLLADLLALLVERVEIGLCNLAEEDAIGPRVR